MAVPSLPSHVAREQALAAGPETTVMRIPRSRRERRCVFIKVFVV
jgi:hypothetical protein